MSLLLNRKMHKLLIFAILTVVTSKFVYDFPNYIQPCSRNAPNLNDCVKRNFEQAQPHFAEGIRKLFVPAMNKFTITRIEMTSDNLNVTAADVDFYGLHNVVLKDVQIDLLKKAFKLEFVFTNFEGYGNVDLQGKLLRSVVTTGGYTYANTTDFHVSLKFDAEEYVKKDNVYLKMKNLQVKTMNKGGFFFDFGNLRKTNEVASHAINDFLNENQDSFVDVISPLIENIFESIVARIFVRMFSQIPYDVLFPYY